MADARRQLNAEIERLLAALDANDVKATSDSLARVDTLRDELTQKVNADRADMLALLQADAAMTAHKQRQAILIAAVLTALAAMLGIVFAILVSGGIARPVRRLLEGTRAVEAGNLDENLPVTSKDEIGHLTYRFQSGWSSNCVSRSVSVKPSGKCRPARGRGTARQAGARRRWTDRVMTVMFCESKALTGASKEVTPQGIVKVMNRYFSVMSAPICDHGGFIDKYIGDAIMAYWGPPFADNADQAPLASLAALEMLERVDPPTCRGPVLLGVRSLPILVRHTHRYRHRRGACW